MESHGFRFPSRNFSLGVGFTGQGPYCGIYPTGSIRLESDNDAASASLRVPVDALEMAGFSHQSKDTVVLLVSRGYNPCEEQSAIKTLPRHELLALLNPVLISRATGPQGALKGTNLRGQIRPKRGFTTIVADLADAWKAKHRGGADSHKISQ